MTAAGQWEAGGALLRLWGRAYKFKLGPSSDRWLGARSWAWWREGCGGGEWRLRLRGGCPGPTPAVPPLTPGHPWRGRAGGWREGAAARRFPGRVRAAAHTQRFREIQM